MGKNEQEAAAFWYFITFEVESEKKNQVKKRALVFK